MQGFIQQAATIGEPIHEVECGLFNRLLKLGYQLLERFFALLGNGDQGKTVTLSDGQVRRVVPFILENAENGLTDLGRELLHDLYQRLRALDQQVRRYDRCLDQLARQDEVCQH